VLFRGNHQARLFEKSFRAQSIPYKMSGSTSFFSKMEVKDLFCYFRLICNFDDDNAFLRVINTPKRGIGKATIEAVVNYAHERGVSLLKVCGEVGLKEHLSNAAYEKVSGFQHWLMDITKKLEGNFDVLPLLKQIISDIDYEAYLFEFCETSSQAEKRLSNVNALIQWIDKLMHKKEDEPLSFFDVIAKLILLDIMERNDDDDLDQVQMMT
jgi:ATP-dependent DNA helicase Rep